MDGLGDDDDDDAKRDGETVDGEVRTVTPHVTTEMLQCLYSDLYGNSAPTKAQMMATGESERSPADAEADAKRVEAELLGFLITVGPISTLPVDSENTKERGGGTTRWRAREMR